MRLSLKRKIHKIKEIIFDFDGVMTNNSVMIDQNGNEFVVVSRADGLGVDLLRHLGYHMMICSSETNPIVQARANKLGIDVIYGIKNKGTAIARYSAEKELSAEEIMYIGNDINDFSAFAHVGCTVVPADACKALKDVADIKLKTCGGYGVVRELADIMFKQCKFASNELRFTIPSNN